MSSFESSNIDQNSENDENNGIYKKLAEMTKNFNDMSLAHTIAVDENFQFATEDFDNDNSIQSTIKKIFHDAFWDILDTQLNETPPNYTQAISLLQELKLNFNFVISERHPKLRDQVDSYLDQEHIQKQLSTDTFELGEYADFVIRMMANLCAPIRDQQVASLYSFKDRPALLFRNIFEIMELMKVDMINFLIKRARPMILQHSVEYEKAKFSTVFETEKDGIEFTKNWLKEAVKRCGDDTAMNILNNAYLDLLNMSLDESYHLPETLILDGFRVVYTSENTAKICLLCAVLSLLSAHVREVTREMLATCYDMLVSKFYPFTYIRLTKNAEDASNVFMEVLMEFMRVGESYEGLRTAIRDELCGNMRVFKLLFERICDFYGKKLRGELCEIPNGLNVAENVLNILGDQFSQLMSYNRTVYGTWYDKIILECKDSNN